MRDDILISEVLAKCDVLKKAGLWPSEPTIRPRAWLNNFDDTDKRSAAFLLDRFTYYNDHLTNNLLLAAYHSLGDGLPKGPLAPAANILIRSLNSALFTPVTGEQPNPSDSGNLFCRKARQVLGIPESLLTEPRLALDHATNQGTVVFLDDFIGSGDQFIRTWNRPYAATSPRTFAEAQQSKSFTAIYIALVSTDFGLQNIHMHAPSVAVCATHVIGEKSTVRGLGSTPAISSAIDLLLNKYSPTLTPSETYIATNPQYLKFGYKNRGLMLGFAHSIPDATLPIFWSRGSSSWTPLVERA